MILTFVVSCDSKNKEYQKHFELTLGGEKFRVPVDYIAFAEQHKDGVYRYVPTKALIPDLKPIENMRHKYRPPTSTNEMISFDLDEHEYTLMNTLLGYERNGFFTLPDFTKEKGVVYLGIYRVGGDKRNKIYAYVKDGSVFARFHCGMSPDYESPSCTVSQKYNSQVS